jgi:hypothetical protein
MPYASVTSPAITDYQNWTHVTGTFTAQTNYTTGPTANTSYLASTYDRALGVYDPSLYVAPGNYNFSYYAIDDISLVGIGCAPVPYPPGTYTSNTVYDAPLQSTNFIQRNGNSVPIQVSLNHPYPLTFTCDNPDIRLSISGNTVSFTIPNWIPSGEGFRLFASTPNSPCPTSFNWIFVPVGYSYRTAPNPASS